MKLKNYMQQHKRKLDKNQMSLQADEAFKVLLKKELHSAKKARLVYLKVFAVAASIALVLGLFWAQNNMNDSDKNQLLASLTDNSAGVRLEGVYRFNDEFTVEDTKIVSALINILHTDKNGNVKLAVIDALLKFPSNENIRVSLITALENEQLPLVQIKLIKSLSFLRENRAQKSLEKIINNTQTFPIVKSNANLAIAQLKQ